MPFPVSAIIGIDYTAYMEFGRNIGVDMEALADILPIYEHIITLANEPEE